MNREQQIEDLTKLIQAKEIRPCLGSFDKQTRNHIKQYWYDKDFNQPYLRL